MQVLLCAKQSRLNFSVTVQRNRIKFCVVIIRSTGCLNLNLGLSCSFSFGVTNVLVFSH